MVYWYISSDYCNCSFNILTGSFFYFFLLAFSKYNCLSQRLNNISICMWKGLIWCWLGSNLQLKKSKAENQVSAPTRPCFVRLPLPLGKFWSFFCIYWQCCKQWRIQGRQPPSYPTLKKKINNKSRRFKNVGKIGFFRLFIQNGHKIYKITKEITNKKCIFSQIFKPMTFFFASCFQFPPLQTWNPGSAIGYKPPRTYWKKDIGLIPFAGIAPFPLVSLFDRILNKKLTVYSLE